MKKCFLCDISDNYVLDFNYESFRKCYLKLLFRKEKGFKYQDVRLPKDATDKFLGYHTLCYKKIIVLSQKYTDEFVTFVNNYEVQIPTTPPAEDSTEHPYEEHDHQHIDEGEITADSTSIKSYKIVNRLGKLRNVKSLQSDTNHGQLNHILNGISRLEKISTQVTETENEYDLFGRSVAIHLKKLPEHAGLELMQKIQCLITDTRILYSQSDGAIKAEDQEFDDSQGDVLIVGSH